MQMVSNAAGRSAIGSPGQRHRCALITLAFSVVALPLLVGPAAAAPQLPAIRTDSSNQVPACVTPNRLMAFLKTRNRRLIPRFRRIAHWYAQHGDAWRVRWDYAFFQMLLETNFLTYKRPNGRWGDVNPKQNNFAGLGTTGGGVPGDSYPDVSTGVLAQIQHLVVYSGERLANPVGPRTRLKQDVILNLSRPVANRRPMTFQDLSGRWAVDKKYGRSIAWVATLFARKYCPNGLNTKPRRVRRDTITDARPPASQSRPQRTARGSARPQRRPESTRESSRESSRTYRSEDLIAARLAAARLGQSAQSPMRPVARCRVVMASYGGTETVLIRAVDDGTTTITALDVVPAQATEMTSGFIQRYAAGGEPFALYKSRTDALGEAFRICPSAAQPLSGG